MALIYLLALLPMAVGIVLTAMNRRVNWRELLILLAVNLAASGAYHAIVYTSLTADHETWSGHVRDAVYEPEWIEEYQQAHTRQVACGTDANGHTQYRTETYYTTEHRTHGPDWWVETTLGRHDIGEGKFKELVANFGGMEAREGSRPGFDGGDRNDYYAVNRNNWLEPVQEFRSFSNPFKASSTVYRFAPVPAGVEVNPYPGNGDFFRSDRLVGGPNVSQLEWDRMNAVLGPTKQVNLILVRFSGKPAEYGKYQEAAWLGGKKNDLVICYGTDSSFTDTATWSYVFGWTEREDVKRNLETLALTNRVNDSFVPLVFAEVKANYVRKNWHDFDYITIQPPLGTMLLWIFLLVAFNGGLLYWMVTNKWTDDTDMDGYGRASYRPWR